MDGRAVRRVGGFPDRLRHRRMGVDGADQFLDRALEAEGAHLTYHDFRNGAALIRYQFR